MHILFMQFYSSTPAPDLHEMAVALRGWGHSVLVATPNGAGDLEWHDGDRVVRTQKGPGQIRKRVRHIRPLAMIASRLAQLAFILRVRSFVKESGAAIVQVCPPEYACCLPMLMPRGMHFILDVRQAGEVKGDDIVGRLRNWKSRMSLRLNARLFYEHSCFATEAAARRILGDRWERWATVHRVGQDVRFLNYQWQEGVSTTGNGPVRFVYIGTISRVRALERLLDAVRRMIDRRTDFHLDFIGPDDTEGYYRDLAHHLGLDGVVSFKPGVPYRDVPAVVASYDAAIAYVPPLPDWKYQPTLKVLEYRALGIPIIASDNEPNREVVEDGMNGLLVDDTPEGIANGLLRLVEDRSLREHCSRHARSMRRGITWGDSAQRYVQVVYERLIHSGTHGHRVPRQETIPGDRTAP
jgi:glycosyltransferase involved in cell wall biosynthesis